MKKTLFIVVLLICLVVFGSLGGVYIKGNKDNSDNNFGGYSGDGENILPEIIVKNINSENELLKDEIIAKDTIIISVYENALMSFLELNRLPDGEYEEIADPGYDMSKNRFAILDIDNDGRKELLLALTNSPMASMRTIIYEYDVDIDAIKQELVEFPEMTFYNNGIIEVKASHNQGMAGDALWPYTLYKYNSKLDTYDRIALVDAWDKSLSDTVGEEKFPDEVDKDGDGIIYYIMLDANYEQRKAVDLAEYEKWRKGYISESSEEIKVEYKPLTKENVQDILSAPVTLLSDKGTTESFEIGDLKLVVTNVKEKKEEARTDGTGEWEEQVFVVYPEAKVHVVDVGMELYEDKILSSYWQFYFRNENDEERKEKILLGMEDIEITKELIAVISENVAAITFEMAE